MCCIIVFDYSTLPLYSPTFSRFSEDVPAFHFKILSVAPCAPSRPRPCPSISSLVSLASCPLVFSLDCPLFSVLSQTFSAHLLSLLLSRPTTPLPPRRPVLQYALVITPLEIISPFSVIFSRAWLSLSRISIISGVFLSSIFYFLAPFSFASALPMFLVSSPWPPCSFVATSLTYHPLVPCIILCYSVIVFPLFVVISG